MAWLLAGLMLVAVPAWAQPVQDTPRPTDRSGRPYRTLFGAESLNRQSLHSVDFSLGMEAASDNAPFSSADNAAAPESEFQEAYSAGATLSYSRQGGTFRFGANVGSTLPYYPDLEGVPVGAAYTASVNLGVTGRRDSLTGSASFSHLPYYTLVWDSTSSIGSMGGALDYAASDDPVNRASAGATYRHEFGRWTSGAASYTRTGGLFTAEERGSRSDTASVSVDREWSRSFSSSLGYSFFRIDYTGGSVDEATTGHGGDVGITYAPKTRRGGTFSLSANVGVARVDDGLEHYVRPRWNVRAQRVIAGSWSATASYDRQMRSYDVLSEATWADSANVQVGGSAGRRVSLGFSGNYSDGESSGGSSIRFLTGAARVRVAIFANLAVDAGYIYVNYRFPPDYDLPGGMAQTMERHRFHVGLSFWLPVARFGRPPSKGGAANE